MAKRFYKQGEMVWLTNEKVKAKVVSLDTKELKARVTTKHKDDVIIEKTVLFKDMDKLKTKDKTKTAKATMKKDSQHKDTVLFAKVRPDAIIPSKKHSEAGYDIYANLPSRMINGNDVREMVLYKDRANLIPTGIACSLLSKYYFDIRHERGSTGKYGMSVVSGVVDSSFRGEIFVNIIPTYKDICITNEVTEVEEHENLILYPYSKAICQGVICDVHDMNIKEITYEELLKIPSERGTGMLGSSNK